MWPPRLIQAALLRPPYLIPCDGAHKSNRAHNVTMRVSCIYFIRAFPTGLVAFGLDPIKKNTSFNLDGYDYNYYTHKSCSTLEWGRNLSTLITPHWKALWSSNLHHSVSLEMPFHMVSFLAKVKILKFWPKTMDYNPWFCFWSPKKVLRKVYHLNGYEKRN